MVLASVSLLLQIGTLYNHVTTQ